MTIDEFVKLILGVALAISILGISVQLMRLIGQVSNTVGDAREGVKSFSRIAKMAGDDYAHISHLLNKGLRLVQQVKRDFVEPFAKLADLVKLLVRIVKKD